MNEYPEFVMSLKRLYINQRITLEYLQKILYLNTISKDEYEFIIRKE